MKIWPYQREMIQFQGHRVSRLTNRIRPKNESEAPVNNVNFSYNNICWVEKVWIVWPHCLDMMCVVVSCCEKFACDKKCLHNKRCTTEHFSCFQRRCVLFISFDRSSNFIEFARQGSLAKCSARLITPHKNNMQQMVTKCCVLLGKKFGSFVCCLLSKVMEFSSSFL